MMVKKIKSYLIFTSLGTRILAFFVEPLALLGIGLFCTMAFGMPGYMLVGTVLIVFEMILDHTMFGGICAKDVSHLEYLKGSREGEKIILAALRGQLIRCFCMDVIFHVVHYVIFQRFEGLPLIDKNGILLVILVVLASYLSIVLADMVVRFWDETQVFFLTMTLALFLEGLIILVAIKHLTATIIIIGILSAVVSVLNVRIALIHIKESYYDKTVEDGI